MEFQAVVMAVGKGSRMTDLTRSCSKALLPVSNLPMVWYPLNLLQTSGFQEAIVITSEATKPRLIKELAGKLKIKLDVVDIPDDDWGTAESLRYIHEKIKLDLLVISCDLITNVSLRQLANLHRTHQATLTALFTPVPSNLCAAVVPGYKGKHSLEKDFIGLDPTTSRLMFLASEADLGEELILRKSLLQKYPKVTVHSQLLDAHLYLMKKWVVDYLMQDTSLSTLKGEVVPFLVEKQFGQPSLNTTNESHGENLVKKQEDIYKISQEDKILQSVRKMSSWNDHSGDMDAPYHDNQIRCYATIVQDCVCIRANTLSSYVEINKQFLVKSQHQLIEPNRTKIDTTASCQGAQVDDASIVGAGSSVAERTRIQASVVGSNCTIGSRVRLTNCIIMNNVVIEEGCVLEGSVLCDWTKVERNATLRDCLVVASQRVAADSKVTKEVVGDADHMMEIV